MDFVAFLYGDQRVQLDVEWIQERTRTALQNDDVLQPAFLSTILLSAPSDSIFKWTPEVRDLMRDQGIHFIGPAPRDLAVPFGPYVGISGNLWQIYRLCADTQGAFFVPLRGRGAGKYAHSYMLSLICTLVNVWSVKFRDCQQRQPWMGLLRFGCTFSFRIGIKERQSACRLESSIEGCIRRSRGKDVNGQSSLSGAIPSCSGDCTSREKLLRPRGDHRRQNEIELLLVKRRANNPLISRQPGILEQMDTKALVEAAVVVLQHSRLVTG